MAEALEVMGRVDGVVANAGAASSSPMHEMTTETYLDMIATAQHGGFWTVREGVKHMVERAQAGDPGGTVIACGSLTTFNGHAGMVHYGAAKGAMARASSATLGKRRARSFSRQRKMVVSSSGGASGRRWRSGVGGSAAIIAIKAEAVSAS